MKNQQKKPSLEDDTSDFPCDIIQSILSRLPVKSLLRFKAVCKSWNATINDSEFTRIHSNQLSISDSHCFYATGLSVDGTYSLIKFEGQEFYEQSVVRCPSKEFEDPNFLCCCEGILLFKYSLRKTSNEYVLWNPFTRNYSTSSFPVDHDIKYGHGYSVSYGLCFDKYEDDYKVIVVSRGSCNYMVYSIKNASWSERQSEFNGSVDSEGVYVDGVVYWTVGQEWSCRDTIIYFDPRDNLLKELHKPTDLEHKSSFFFLTNLRGNLCCFTNELEIIRIWLLKESGGRKYWMKLMTVNYSELPVRHIGMFRTFLVHRPMYLTSNNEVVFQSLNGTRYAFYCLEKQKFGEVKEFPACCMMIRSTCSESLNFPATRKEG